MEDAESLPTGAVISFGPFRLYPAERLVRRHDETLLLGGRALDILITLVEQAGEVVTPTATDLARLARCDSRGGQSSHSHRWPPEDAR